MELSQNIFVWRNYKNNFETKCTRYFLMRKNDSHLTMHESSVNLDFKCQAFFALINKETLIGKQLSNDTYSQILRSLVICCNLDPILCEHLKLENLNLLATLSVQLYNIYNKKLQWLNSKGSKEKTRRSELFENILRRQPSAFFSWSQ